VSSRWKGITRLRFKGTRFNDRALDAAALEDVQRYLRLIEEMAKELWRAEHPERERLPAGFEEQNRTYLRQIQRGSAVAVIEARVDDKGQTEFLDRDAETLLSAAELGHTTYAALVRNKPLPERLPKRLVNDFAELGKSLGNDDVLEIKAATRKLYVAYRPQYRDRWGAFAVKPYESRLTQVGEIFEADVKHGRFQVWTERGGALPASFKPEQEAFITSALKDHNSVRVRVAGRGEYTADGKPVRFIEVTGLTIEPREPLLFDPNAPSIEEEIEEIWKDMPASEWSKVPADLSDNLDHYLYGAPKK